LHVVLALQAGRVLNQNVDVFNASEFNRIYHRFYGFVLLSRNQDAGQQWELRTAANVLAERFVETTLAARPDMLGAFRLLHSQFFSFAEFNRFSPHFPDDFKVAARQKGMTGKHAPRMPTSNNPFACLQHLPTE
jgi:hypothetical protein